jgi:hypothetical protein
MSFTRPLHPDSLHKNYTFQYKCSAATTFFQLARRLQALADVTVIIAKMPTQPAA